MGTAIPADQRGGGGWGGGEGSEGQASTRVSWTRGPNVAAWDSHQLALAQRSITNQGGCQAGSLRGLLRKEGAQEDIPGVRGSQEGPTGQLEKNAQPTQQKLSHEVTIQGEQPGPLPRLCPMRTLGSWQSLGCHMATWTQRSSTSSGWPSAHVPSPPWGLEPTLCPMETLHPTARPEQSEFSWSDT